MTPYIGMISAFGFAFAPKGWAQCKGQLLPIQQNQALFAILGTTYGGNGVQTFGLPNLQGRSVVSWGNSSTGTNYVLGEIIGTESVTLLQSNMPAHTHAAVATMAASTNGGSNAGSDPTNMAFAPTSTDIGNLYSNTTTPNVHMAGISMHVNNSGSGQPMNILNPYVVINYSIALQGIFPSRN